MKRCEKAKQSLSCSGALVRMADSLDCFTLGLTMLGWSCMSVMTDRRVTLVVKMYDETSYFIVYFSHVRHNVQYFLFNNIFINGLNWNVFEFITCE